MGIYADVFLAAEEEQYIEAAFAAQEIDMSDRTLADIEKDIKSATDARESMASLPSSEPGKWDEGRAIFIENCNNRISALVKEREKLQAKETP